MGTSNLRTLFVISGLLSLALGQLIIKPPNGNGNGPQVEQQCDSYCELTMKDDSIRVMQIGETFPSPEHKCEEYKCSAGGVLGVQVITCDIINLCGDGKAPYKLPDQCCDTCQYSQQLAAFGGSSIDLRGNATIEPPKPNTWSKWSPWTSCSRECGGGRQSRMRQCNTEGAAKLDCTGDVVEIQDCNEHPCPIHGGWSQWTEWTDCSVSCSNGTQSRIRTCDSPAPQHGGDDCVGESGQVRDCFLRHCPVDCVWLPWSEWGECSKDCGSGSQSRTRQQLVEKWGGASCDGEALEHRLCNTQHCPIDGKWTPWTEWSACSVTCATGTQSRSRSCADPPPQYGGLDCDGESNETRPCFERHCPINCAWLSFSEWSACSKSCDGGVIERTRSFIAAKFGGEECEGDLREVELCNTQACPDPCIDNPHPCFNDEVTCKKLTDTEFECGSCPRGMRGDGIHCTVVNECEEANPCFPGVECIDYDDGYLCGSCPVGYRGSPLRGYDLMEANSLVQSCLDVNECDIVPNGGCTWRRECENTLGSFVCGPCMEAGWIEKGATECTVANPCEADLHDCVKKEYCINHAIAEFHCECPIGTIGNGKECSSDGDLDGVANEQLTIGCDHPPCQVDNCPDVPNSAQQDMDNDGIGDACDTDADNDGVRNQNDNCPFIHNQWQQDRDGDRVGDVCDNCPKNRNRKQKDFDGDGLGDACDPDLDGDTYLNAVDVCPFFYNPNQEDSDGDKRGNWCDNCPYKANNRQTDSDQDSVGDSCDTNIDQDNDGIQDDLDDCPTVPNCDQLDTDSDGWGDACDQDSDGDGHDDIVDNCPKIVNPDQVDTDGNGVGDMCEEDRDGDGVADTIDVCPDDPTVSRTDFSSQFLEVNLESTGKPRNPPAWEFHNNGTEIRQTANSGPNLLVGKDRFTDVEFNGTFFVSTHLDDDYAGFVFNFQSNKRFHLMSWKQQGQMYWKKTPFVSVAQAGIQLQSVNSVRGPGTGLRNAIWNTGNIKNEVKMLYHDPNNVGWADRKSYRWNLQYSSESSCMRLRVYTKEGMFLDTECVCDESIKGGRLGVYVFEQANVSFSDLSYACLNTEQKAALSECAA